MTVQKGKDILIKMDVAGVWFTVAGIKATKTTFNRTTIDITNASSVNLWREFLSGAGIRSASVTGSGIFLDSTGERQAVYAYNSTGIKLMQIYIPGLGSYEGNWAITQLDYTGDHDKEMNYSMTLESAGELTFVEI